MCRLRDANGFAPGGGTNQDGNGDGTLEEAMYYITDANHNVTALLDGSRDGQGGPGPRFGQVVERYLYDTYGRVTVLNGAADKDSPAQGPAVAQWSPDADDLAAAQGTGAPTDRIGDWDNEILFAGYRYDPATGLYHVRHRAYDVCLGWLQRDPAQDGANLYGYCGNGPMGTRDPFGLWKYDLVRNEIVVEKGDTLWAISRGLTGKGSLWQTLFGRVPSKIKPGQRFLIQSPGTPYVIAWDEARFREHVTGITWEAFTKQHDNTSPRSQPTNSTSQPASKPASQPASQPAMEWEFVEWREASEFNWLNNILGVGDVGTCRLYAVCRRRGTTEKREFLAAIWGEGDAGSGDLGHIGNATRDPGDMTADAFDNLTRTMIKFSVEGVDGPKRLAKGLGWEFFASGGAPITRDDFYGKDAFARFLKLLAERGCAGGDPWQ